MKIVEMALALSRQSLYHLGSFVVTTGTTFYLLLSVGHWASNAILAVFTADAEALCHGIGLHRRRDRDQPHRRVQIPGGAIMDNAMSLRDVARALAVPAYRIEYRLAHGLVPEPSLRIAGRRVFSSQDVANLAASFGVMLPATAEPAAAAAGV
jgi:hypothetical protein